MSSGWRPKLSATARTFSRDRAVEVDHAPGARSDRDRAHVHVGQPAERALGRDSEHRHRADAAARDDAATLDRVEREVDALPAGATLPPGVSASPEREPITTSPVDGQVVERRLHRARSRFLGRLLVRTAEPARTRERRPLGRPRVAGAEAVGHCPVR